MRTTWLALICFALSGCSCGKTSASKKPDAGSGGSGSTGGSGGSSGGSTGGATCSGSAPLCPNQLGVCAGSHRPCVDGGWADCTAAEYGAGYSVTETTCDGLDHNCDGVPSGTVACAGSCCRADQACAGSACVDQGATCSGDSDCRNDTHCVGGACVAWADGGFDPTCTSPVEPPHFSPSIRCAWPPAGFAGPDPSHIQVITTPLVADLGLYPEAHPMVVFPTQNSLGGGGDECVGNATNFGLIRVLDPQSCAVVATLDGADQHVVGSSTPAIGDLDGDGKPEIVAAAVGGGLVAFKYDAAGAAWVTLWHSTAAGAPSNPFGADCNWGGPSLADVDGDGQPEVVFGGSIYSRDGMLVGGALGENYLSPGQIPVLADVDLQGGPELIDGAHVYAYDSSLHDWVPAPYFSGSGLANGFVALGRFGSFPVNGSDPGYPQIAVVHAGQVRVQTIGGEVVFGPYALPAGSGGGPPTVGDFNGDGQPDIAAASSDSFTVFSFHCRPDAGPLPADCQAEGILWSRGSQDHSSNVTGSSLFDFTGSGRVNGVYADECFARVYDGPTGEAIYSQWHSSCTWYENPVVADVLANYSSQLVVGSNQNCSVSCAGSTEDDGAGRQVDRFFNGLHCDTAADCPSAGDACVGGLCRCQTDDDCCGTAGACPQNGFVCAPPPAAGDPASGKTCRAVYNGAYAGVRIYADAKDRWADSRSIWNQHAYAVTNVNDDGTIPPASQARHNWQIPGLNNFRENVQGQLTPLAASHLEISLTSATCDASRAARLLARVCNRGAGGVVGGAPVRFEDGSGNVLCDSATSGPLAPGACEDFECDWPQVPAGPQTVNALVDPDGTTRPCDPAGRSAQVTGLVCSFGGR